MNANEIITQRKNTTGKVYALFLTSLLLSSLTGVYLLGTVTDLDKSAPRGLLAAGVFVILLGLIALSSFMFTKFYNPTFYDTINNIEKHFDIKLSTVIEGDLTSNGNQTIIFTGVKDNEYSNFTAVIKDDVFTLTQHDPANFVEVTSTVK